MIINYKDMPDNFCNVSSDDIIELEPCPFCGSRAYLNYDSSRRNYGHCSKCHAEGGRHRDEKEAIKLWNNRAYSEEKMTIYEREGILSVLENLTKKAIDIPDGITNGEVIRTLFPNLYSFDGENYVLLDLSGFCRGKIEKKWWNSPYKAGDTE